MLVAIASRKDVGPEDLIAAARRGGADLLILGEFFLDREDGIESDDPLIEEFGGLVAGSGLCVLAGYRERCTTGLFSSAQLFDPDGHSISNCRAAHPGTNGLDEGNWLTVSCWPKGRLSALPGDDILFPEIARGVMLKGAELLIALRSTPLADTGLEQALLRVRAVENRVATIGLFADHAAAFAADGSPIEMQPADNGLLLARLPPISLAKPARRPELYQQLAVLDDHAG